MPKRTRPKTIDPQPARALANPNAAGLDIGGAAHYAAVPKDRDPQPVRAFGCFTADLAALAAWFKSCKIATVVMEATGAYWIPVADRLEAAGFEVLLVDPRSLARSLRKKSDVADCRWLQELHAFGLLKGCFRPDGQTRELRALWRHRAHLTTESARTIQRIQKTLVQMNVHLHLAVSDVAGVTGMRILRAIVKGERDPRKLAQLRDRGCRKSAAEIAKALEGNWREEHLFELKLLLQTHDFQRTQIGALDKRVEKAAAQFPDRREGRALPAPTTKKHASRSTPDLSGRELVHRMTGVDLTQVEGLGANTCLTVLSETGPDLSKFRTAKAFAAWTGLAPRRDQSGKRDRPAKLPARGASRAAQALRLAARSLMGSASSLGQYLRRMRARLGPAIAIRATAAKLARLFWTLVTKRAAYRPEDAAAYEARERERRLKRLANQAKAEGLQLTPLQPAAA